MFSRKCKITFIAHGATIHTQDGIINDTLKYPKINETGEEEIEKVCEFLQKREVGYDKIYSSPEACCTQSANIIAKLFKKKASVIDLKNRAHGDWQGNSILELYKENGENVFTETPQNGEALVDFNKRVHSTIKKLIEENTGNRIIVVTTQEIIQSALANVLKTTPKNQHKMLIKTGSLTQISYFEDWASIIYSDYIPI